MILSSVEGDEGLYQSKLLAVGPKQFNNQICLTFGQIQTFIPLYKELHGQGFKPRLGTARKGQSVVCTYLELVSVGEGRAVCLVQTSECTNFNKRWLTFHHR